MVERHSASYARMQVIKRSEGRSVVAAAAYRAGVKLHDERRDVSHDYRRKTGIGHVEVVGWKGDLASLWNAAERAEMNADGTYRKTAQTAREWVLAIPNEMTDAEAIGLVRGFALSLRDRYGVALSTAIHDPDKNHEKMSKTEDDGLDMSMTRKNLHAHILFTTRAVDMTTATGFAKKKVQDLANRTSPGRDNTTGKALKSPGVVEVEWMRDEWSKRVNRLLEKKGVELRVDLRSNAKRAALGIAPSQVSQGHLGPRLHTVKRAFETVEARAKKTGAVPPPAPSFVLDHRRRKKLNSRVRELWSVAREVSFDALLAGSNGGFERIEDNALTDLDELFGAIGRGKRSGAAMHTKALQAARESKAKRAAKKAEMALRAEERAAAEERRKNAEAVRIAQVKDNSKSNTRKGYSR